MIAFQTDSYLQTLDNIRDIFQHGKVMKAITVIVQFLDTHPDHPEGLELFGTLLIETANQLESNVRNGQKDDDGTFLTPDIKAEWIGIVSDTDKNNAAKVTDAFQKLMARASSLEVENLLSAEVRLVISSLLTRMSIISFYRAIKFGAGAPAVEHLTSILMAENRIDEAAKIIAVGIDKNPGDVAIMALQVKIFDIMDMPDDADDRRLSVCSMLINKRESTLGATSMETKIVTKFSKDIAKAGNGDEADRIMKTRMSRHPVTTDQLVDQAWTFYYSGLNELARETAYKAGVIAPQRKDVLALLKKTVFTKIGGMNKLDELLRSAISSPDDPDVFCSLGNALRDKGRHMEAVAAFRTALKHDPDCIEARLQIIFILRDKHHLEAATIMSKDLTSMAPNNPLVHVRYGDLMSESGRPLDAVTSYRKAVKLDPSVTGIHRTIGKQLLNAGRLKEALSAFYSAVSHNPDNYRDLEELADAITLSGRYGDATAWLRRALLLNKNSATIKQKLAESLLRCEHWDEGKKYLSVSPPKPRFVKPGWDGSSPVSGALLAFHRPEDPIERTLIGLGVAARMASSGYSVICECPPSVIQIGIPPASGISVIKYLSNNVGEPASNTNITDQTPLADLMLIPGQQGLPLPEWLSAESKESIDQTPISNVVLAHSPDALRPFPGLNKLFNKIESKIGIPAKRIKTDAKLSAITTTIKLTDAVITDDAVVALVSGALGVPSIFIVANNAPWWWGDHRGLSPWARRQMMIRVDTATKPEEIVGKVRRMLDDNIPARDREPRVRPSMHDRPLIEMFDRIGSSLGHNNGEIIKVEALSSNYAYRAFCQEGDKFIRIGRFPPPMRGFFTNEIRSMRAASKVGLAAQVIIADVSDGAMVCEFIDGVTMNRKAMKLFVNVLSVARMFIRLHALKPFRGRFDIFKEIEKNTKQLQRNKVGAFIENKIFHDLIKRIRTILADNGVPARPCHNSPLLQNFIIRHGKTLLINWGKAGMSDPHWELSAISVQADMDDDLRDSFLNKYFEVDNHPALCRIPLLEVACCYYWWTDTLCADLNKPEGAKNNGEADDWWNRLKERASHERFAAALNVADNYRWKS